MDDGIWRPILCCGEGELITIKRLLKCFPLYAKVNLTPGGIVYATVKDLLLVFIMKHLFNLLPRDHKVEISCYSLGWSILQWTDALEQFMHQQKKCTYIDQQREKEVIHNKSTRGKNVIFGADYYTRIAQVNEAHREAVNPNTARSRTKDCLIWSQLTDMSVTSSIANA